MTNLSLESDYYKFSIGWSSPAKMLTAFLRQSLFLGISSESITDLSQQKGIRDISLQRIAI